MKPLFPGGSFFLKVVVGTIPHALVDWCARKLYPSRRTELPSCPQESFLCIRLKGPSTTERRVAGTLGVVLLRVCCGLEQVKLTTFVDIVRVLCFPPGYKLMRLCPPHQPIRQGSVSAAVYPTLLVVCAALLSASGISSPSWRSGWACSVILLWSDRKKQCTFWILWNAQCPLVLPGTLQGSPLG